MISFLSHKVPCVVVPQRRPGAESGFEPSSVSLRSLCFMLVERSQYCFFPGSGRFTATLTAIGCHTIPVLHKFRLRSFRASDSVPERCYSSSEQTRTHEPVLTGPLLKRTGEVMNHEATGAVFVAR